MLFEMATGDFLFEPRNGSKKTYSQDDDHLAQMIELLGPMPKSMAVGGTKYNKMFKNGQLKRIKGLNYWPLHKVLQEKYRFKEQEAIAFADFLMPMLIWDPEKRASAQYLLSHPWLQMESNYDTRNLTKDKSSSKGDEVAETANLVDSDIEQNAGDNELSTMSDFSDLFSDSSDMPAHVIKRDIASGQTLNNSFTGPYPEETDHLHLDKGANPQFDFLKHIK
jgi:serine/threonine protein kinase